MAKVYEEIADDLRQRVRAGQLVPGTKLDAETKLTERYRTSLPTVRQALSVLQAEGLIEKRHGRGNFVRQPRKLVKRDNSRHQWEKDRARSAEIERRETGATEHDTGLTIDDLHFTARYQGIDASPDLASVFDVPAGTRLLERIYRTRYRAEEAPFNLVHSYLVHETVAGNPDLLDAANEPWPGGTQNQLHTIGIELDRITERITARPPTAEEAKELGLTPGVSVLVMRKTSYDVTGRAVEVSDVTMPGDRTELLYTTPLARW